MEYRSNILYRHYEPGVEEESIFEAALALSHSESSASLLPDIADFISEHIGVKHIVIGRISDDHASVQTLVVMENRQVKGNFMYALKGTPCEASIAQSFCYYPYDVTLSFPDDKELREMQIESYLGSILLSEYNKPFGLTALMDTKQIANAAFAQHLIMILSPAIEQEIKKTVA